MNRTSASPALLLLLWAVPLLLTNSVQAQSDSPQAPPNILLIVTDELSINDLACYGGNGHPTPNVDSLAADGARFVNAYCAQPLNSASRAALLTGTHPAPLHLTNSLPARPETASELWLGATSITAIPKDVPTIAARLKGTGYSTGLIGKSELGDEHADRDFDFSYAGKTASKAKEDESGTTDLADHAVAFIEERKAKPFFLIVSLDASRSLDDAVGRVLKKLDDAHLVKQTIVVFTSDTGRSSAMPSQPATGTFDSRYRAGRGFLYEGGLRVPLIIRWPDVVKRASKVDVIVTTGDLPHTFAEIAKTPGGWGKPYDGVSLVKLLAGDASKAPPEIANRTLFWHLPHYTKEGGRPSGAIREGNWKLIEDYDFGGAELYNLAIDAGETKDVSMKEANRVADLRGKLAACRIEINAGEMTPNPEARFGLWKKLYVDANPSAVQLEITPRALLDKESAWQSMLELVNRPRVGADGKEDPEAVKLLDANPPGFIVLPAKDAKVHLAPEGKLRYEPQPQKMTLGYWVNAADKASWDFDVKEPGTYAVYVLQGCGGGGAEVEISVPSARGDANAFTFKVQDTGHFQNFISREVGKLKLEAGKQTLTVNPKSKPGVAVMDLRRVTLVRAE